MTTEDAARLTVTDDGTGAEADTATDPGATPAGGTGLRGTGSRGPRSPGAAPEAARAAAVQADGFAVVCGSQAHIRTAPTARTAVPVVKTRA